MKTPIKYTFYNFGEIQCKGFGRVEDLTLNYVNTQELVILRFTQWFSLGVKRRLEPEYVLICPACATFLLRN